MDNLINKYLNNDLTVEEAEKLKSWLQKDVRNRIEFENIVTHLKHSDSEFDAIRDKVLSRIVSGEHQSGRSNFKPVHKIRYILQVAAVFAVFFTSLLVLREYQYVGKEETNTISETGVEVEKEAAFGQKLTFKLPDGTSVKLNAGSKLIFPKDFDDKYREVELIGEAFFDVSRDENRPFHIKTNAINVSVLGTSFNIRSYDEDETVSVGVRTGIVKVSDLNGQEEVLLRQNHLASYSTKTKQMVKDTINEREIVFGWMDKELVFKDYTIDQIMVELSRWFDVEFKIARQLDKKRKFTTRYQNPTLESVMESLSYVYGYKYEIDERTVTIK